MREFDHIPMMKMKMVMTLMTSFAAGLITTIKLLAMEDNLHNVNN